MKYDLKNKLIITKDFLKDLEVRSWQEIDYLQNQIANLEESPESLELIKLLKNLLTSQYVFAGGLEGLVDSFNTEKVVHKTVIDKPEAVDEQPKVELPEDDFSIDIDFDLPKAKADIPVVNMDIEEPFEYFVDFDEPVGDPLTDDDLYNN